MRETAAKLGEELVKKNLPRFVEMVNTAIENQNFIVSLDPQSFKGEPELMYAAVYYALARDVIVTFHNHTGGHPKDLSLVERPGAKS